MTDIPRFFIRLAFVQRAGQWEAECLELREHNEALEEAQIRWRKENEDAHKQLQQEKEDAERQWRKEKEALTARCGELVVCSQELAEESEARRRQVCALTGTPLLPGPSAIGLRVPTKGNTPHVPHPPQVEKKHLAPPSNGAKFLRLSTSTAASAAASAAAAAAAAYASPSSASSTSADDLPSPFSPLISPRRPDNDGEETQATREDTRFFSLEPSSRSALALSHLAHAARSLPLQRQQMPEQRQQDASPQQLNPQQQVVPPESVEAYETTIARLTDENAALVADRLAMMAAHQSTRLQLADALAAQSEKQGVAKSEGQVARRKGGAVLLGATLRRWRQHRLWRGFSTW